VGEGAEGAGIDVFVVAEDGRRDRALALATELRQAGLRTDLDLAGRSVKGQMKQADRLGARRVVILEADGVQLRDMESGEQRALDAARAVEELKE
jgi:histidyl-tRNA synthetase